MGNAYAIRFKDEKTPVRGGRQYRAEEVEKIDDNCNGCAGSSEGFRDSDLCKKLPPCTMGNRLDGLNVRYVDCGKAVPK
jgi:hypothetical protein